MLLFSKKISVPLELKKIGILRIFLKKKEEMENFTMYNVAQKFKM